MLSVYVASESSLKKLQETVTAVLPDRAIWIDGTASEPTPVHFEGLDAIELEGGRLEFSARCERRKEERRAFVSYSYRQPFGSFTGTLPGGLELAEGFGVIEHHDAHW